MYLSNNRIAFQYFEEYEKIYPDRYEDVYGISEKSSFVCRGHGLLQFSQAPQYQSPVIVYRTQRTLIPGPMPLDFPY